MSDTHRLTTLVQSMSAEEREWLAVLLSRLRPIDWIAVLRYARIGGHYHDEK
jgi:hypothetical protein